MAISPLRRRQTKILAIMKRSTLFLICLLLYVNLSANQKEYTKYVNPFTGSDLHGHTFPGAVYPFGMVQLSPDTRLEGWDGCSGYHYSDSTIYGFSHTHLSGTGVADYCDVLFMPVCSIDTTRAKAEQITNSLYKSTFSHTNESAEPGYYSVFLNSKGIKAELTAGKRCGLHRYTYPKGERVQLIIDLNHRDRVISNSIQKYNSHSAGGSRISSSWAKRQSLFFYVEFSLPIKSFIENNGITIIEFEGTDNILEARVALSSVSEQNAKLNLLGEDNSGSFDSLRATTMGEWNSYLGKIDVESNDINLLRTFYTALYHTAIHPSLYSDINGEYRGMDNQIHTACGYERYTVFSLWDTFRTLHPLLTIIEPERAKDFIQSMLSIYRENGKLPVWELWGNETDCMIGYHSASVIADAIAKGIGGFDKKEALQALLESSNKNEYGINLIEKYGYLPGDLEHESVSKTLEYAYDDWCIAMIAKELGDKSIYDRYIKRAAFYKNIFDPQTGFMRPKINGKWLSPFLPQEVNVHFTEANSWQYSFFVPQDILGHIELLGGNKKYIDHLDSLFSTSPKTTGRTQVDITGLIGQYAHGNEPSHHSAYLYSLAGAPHKSAQRLREIMETLYSAEPDGRCGNEDCGQMSAWYVMSAIGIYPVTPGSDLYVVGSPLFTKSTIKLQNGNEFSIIASGNSQKNKFVQSTNIKDNYITINHKYILDGGKLCLKMGATPPTTHFKADFPISPGEITPNTWHNSSQDIFMDSLIISIGHINKNCKQIEYCVIEEDGYGKDKVKDKNKYKNKDKYGDKYVENLEKLQYRTYAEPLTIHKSSKIISRAGQSLPNISSFKKIENNISITIPVKYNPQYNAGGKNGLIDGIRGKENFRLGGWQGYQATDFYATIDLGKNSKITRVGAGFLSDSRSWILLPKYIDIYISNDGIEYNKVGSVTHSIDPQESMVSIHDLTLDNLNIEGRYIKIFAKNFGTLPSWHQGAGGEAFIFIDEILIDYL